MTLAPCSLGQRRVCPSLQWMGILTELELAPCHLIPLVPPSVQCMCVATNPVDSAEANATLNVYGESDNIGIV